MCYARKPRNCLIIDVVMNLYSITLLMSLHSRVRYIRTHISALPCESVSEPSQSQLVRRVCTYIHTYTEVCVHTYVPLQEHFLVTKCQPLWLIHCAVGTVSCASLLSAHSVCLCMYWSGTPVLSPPVHESSSVYWFGEIVLHLHS